MSKKVTKTKSKVKSKKSKTGKPAKKASKTASKKAAPKEGTKKVTAKKVVRRGGKKATSKKVTKKATKKPTPKKSVAKKAVAKKVVRRGGKKTAPAKINAITKKAVILKTKKTAAKKITTPAVNQVTKLGADSPELLKAIVDGLEERKAKNITVIGLTRFANRSFDYFVVADADSNTHVESIAASVEDEVKKKINERPYHTEGWQNAEWILLDYINIVVHVFQRPVREFYNLEGLWADADVQKIN